MRACIFTVLLLTGCEPGSVGIIDDDGVDDTDLSSDTGLDSDTDPDTDPVPEADCDPFGVSVGEAAVIDHDSVIDGWNGGPEPVLRPTTVSINSAAECALDVRRGRISGDIQVGPRGYPDVVICAGRGAELTGEQGILDAEVPLGQPPLPPDLPENGGDKLMEWNERATFSVDRVFDDLRVRTNAELVIDGDIDIHVRGDLEFNRGVLVLTEGSELDVWVDGGAQFIWGSQINVDGDPAALRVHLRDGVTLGMEHGSVAAARVKAPEAAVRVAGRGTTLRGTVQARELAVEWGGRIAADPDLICED